jgi:hypothetical protein
MGAGAIIPILRLRQNSSAARMGLSQLIFTDMAVAMYLIRTTGRLFLPVIWRGCAANLG